VAERERKDGNFLERPQPVIGFVADPRHSA